MHRLVMQITARTLALWDKRIAASGGAQLLPEVLAFSSSLPLDRQLLREDVIGSLAHLIMLSRTGIVPREAASRIRSKHILLR